MPKRQRITPTDNWQQLELRFTSPEQRTYGQEKSSASNEMDYASQPPFPNAYLLNRYTLYA